VKLKRRELRKVKENIANIEQKEENLDNILKKFRSRRNPNDIKKDFRHSEVIYNQLFQNTEDKIFTKIKGNLEKEQELNTEKSQMLKAYHQLEDWKSKKGLS